MLRSIRFVIRRCHLRVPPLTNALNILFILSNLFINIALVTVLSFYLTLDGKRIRDSIISIVPKRSLSNVLLFEDALNRVVGNYIRGQLTLALIIGICAGGICHCHWPGKLCIDRGCAGLSFLRPFLW